VQDELKHYAVMSGKTIVHDFCAIGPHKKTNSSRLLVGAADEEKTTELIKAFNRVGINIKAIEPPVLSGARLVYSKYIAKNFSANVLVAVYHNGAITLCVFSDTNLDYIHSFEIGESDLSSAEAVQILTNEIAAVRQFYNVEIENAKPWEIIVIADQEQKNEQLQQSLRTELPGTNVRVLSFASLQTDTNIIVNREAAGASTISAGLAIKYFKSALMRWDINLFPAGADEMHNVQKFALTMAAVAIIAFLVSLATIPLLQMKIDNINKAAAGYKEKQLNEDTAKIITQIAGLNEKRNALTEKTEALKSIIESTDSVRKWDKILSDIGSRTPKTVRIVNLTSKDNTGMSLVGQASSYDTINKFVKLLDKSPYISSATLVKSEIDPTTENLLLYNIACKFAVKEKANAD
jgi:Tfp pilus assembly protein PilN